MNENAIAENSNIKISGDIPHGVTFHVKVGNEERIIDSDTKEIGFAVDKPGRYWMEFEEEATANEEPIGNPGLHLLVKLIGGAIYAFQAFGDSGKWEKNIKAYVVKGRFEIELVDKLNLVLTYTPSVYNAEQEDWSYPSLQLAPSLKSETDYRDNPLDFTNKLSEYISGITMASGLSSIFFGFIAVKAFLNDSTAVALTFSGLVAGVIILAVGVIKSQRKRCRRLYEIFVNRKSA